MLSVEYTFAKIMAWFSVSNSKGYIVYLRVRNFENKRFSSSWLQNIFCFEALGVFFVTMDVIIELPYNMSFM